MSYDDSYPDKLKKLGEEYDAKERAKCLFRHIMKHGIDYHRFKVDWTFKKFSP